MTTTPHDAPEALVEQVMAGVRAELGKSHFEWVTKSPEGRMAFLMGALTALSQQVGEAHIEREVLGLFREKVRGGFSKRSPWCDSLDRLHQALDQWYDPSPFTDSHKSEVRLAVSEIQTSLSESAEYSAQQIQELLSGCDAICQSEEPREALSYFHHLKDRLRDWNPQRSKV
jgi:hypothetical protein